jgi:hypothetical protein
MDDDTIIISALFSKILVVSCCQSRQQGQQQVKQLNKKNTYNNYHHGLPNAIAKPEFLFYRT